MLLLSISRDSVPECVGELGGLLVDALDFQMELACAAPLVIGI